MDEEWAPPELKPGDFTIESEVVEVDGRRTPIVLAALMGPDGGATVTGYNRSLDLPPGAHIAISLDELFSLIRRHKRRRET